MEALLASLPVPIVVAVATALITSWLSAKRSAADRVAEMRLKAYSEAIVAANQWGQTVSDVRFRQKAIEGTWQEFNDMHKRLQLLSVVASERSLKRLRPPYMTLIEEGLFQPGEEVPDQLAVLKHRQESVAELVELLIREARREIRKTRI